MSFRSASPTTSRPRTLRLRNWLDCFHLPSRYPRCLFGVCPSVRPLSILSRARKDTQKTVRRTTYILAEQDTLLGMGLRSRCGLGYSKVKRTVVASGYLHEIACAVIQDGTSPAGEVLEQFASGQWEEDPDVEGMPDDAQIKDYDLFLAAMEYFTENGVPHSPQVQLNALRHGIWEFKVHRKRFSFFDTDGQGRKFEPMKFHNREECTYPDDENFWHVPDFEQRIRLGHCFPKLTDRTSERDLRRTLQVRTEDLEHDRKEANAR